MFHSNSSSSEQLAHEAMLSIVREQLEVGSCCYSVGCGDGDFERAMIFVYDAEMWSDDALHGRRQGGHTDWLDYPIVLAGFLRLWAGLFGLLHQLSQA